MLITSNKLCSQDIKYKGTLILFLTMSMRFQFCSYHYSYTHDRIKSFFKLKFGNMFSKVILKHLRVNESTIIKITFVILDLLGDMIRWSYCLNKMC